MKNKKDKFNFRKFIKETDFKPLILDFIKWKLIDIYRYKKYGKPLNLFGIRCITGMYGQGKTMAMSKIALDFRKKYGNDIYICSNYGLLIQDFAFTDTNQLLEVYDKPVIFFWDEVQNTFPSSNKEFNPDVRRALTLNRKGKGKMFFWASQDHELVAKTIRRLTIEYGQVRTLWGRYTRVKWYLSDDYQRLFDQVNVDKKMKIHPFKKEKFIQNDYIRGLYDSYAWDNGEKIDVK